MRKPAKTSAAKKSRKTYRAPKLTTHGNVAKLTQQRIPLAASIINLPSHLPV